jgi:hypothetical protein
MHKKTKILYVKAAMTNAGMKSCEEIYRVIAINDHIYLHEFAKVIVTSFDLDFEAIYGFYHVDTAGVETGIIFEGNAVAGSYETDVRNITIGSVFSEKNRLAAFLYGDNNEWRFSLELSKVIDGCDKIKLPAIVQSHGEVPPPFEDFIYHS